MVVHSHICGHSLLHNDLVSVRGMRRWRWCLHHVPELVSIVAQVFQGQRRDPWNGLLWRCKWTSAHRQYMCSRRGSEEEDKGGWWRGEKEWGIERKMETFRVFFYFSMVVHNNELGLIILWPYSILKSVLTVLLIYIYKHIYKQWIDGCMINKAGRGDYKVKYCTKSTHFVLVGTWGWCGDSISIQWSGLTPPVMFQNFIGLFCRLPALLSSSHSLK